MPAGLVAAPAGYDQTMMFPHDHIATIASTLVAGLFMLRLSLSKRAVTWRLPVKCPSCGRLAPRGRCSCTS